MCQKNDYARRAITALLVILTALFVLSETLNAQTTAFGYQERLTDAGATATADDWQFTLYDEGNAVSNKPHSSK